jgi:protoporphyrinogen oxidase
MSVAIIGAGLSGLSCGYQIAKEGLKVKIFEKEPFIGGLASCYNYDGVNIPKTYHHILGSDTPLLQMLKELGLSVEWQKVKVGFHNQDKIYPFNGPLDLLKFKPLPLAERLKLGLLFLSTRRSKSLEDLEKVSIQKWIETEVGTEAYQKLIEPLISSYFGSGAEISAAYLANRWRTESKSVTGLLGYLDISEITHRLEKVILENEGIISREANIKEIKIEDDHFILKLDHEEYNAKYLVSTVPPSILTSIFKTMPLDCNEELSKVSYMGCICVTYWLSEKVSEYYWINVLDRDYPFVACFEHANLNPQVSGGIVYAISYLNENNIMWKKSDEEIADYFTAYLSKIYGGFKDIKHLEVFRTLWATPVFEVGYKTPPITPIKNLYLSGISRIFPDIRSMGPAIRTGIEASNEILKEVKLTS